MAGNDFRTLPQGMSMEQWAALSDLYRQRDTDLAVMSPIDQLLSKYSTQSLGAGLENLPAQETVAHILATLPKIPDPRTTPARFPGGSAEHPATLSGEQSNWDLLKQGTGDYLGENLPDAIETLSMAAPMGKLALGALGSGYSGDAEASPWEKMLQLVYHGGSTGRPLARGIVAADPVRHHVSGNALFAATDHAAAQHYADSAVKRYGGDPVIHSLLIDPSNVGSRILSHGDGTFGRSFALDNPASQAKILNDAGQLEQFASGGQVQESAYPQSFLEYNEPAWPLLESA
jgi:hypothetical protein